MQRVKPRNVRQESAITIKEQKKRHWVTIITQYNTAPHSIAQQGRGV